MRAVAISLAAGLIVGCSEKWDGFVYPDKTLLQQRQVAIGTFSSIDDCRRAAIDKLAEMRAIKQGDWECGRDCIGDGYTKICKETRRY